MRHVLHYLFCRNDGFIMVVFELHCFVSICLITVIIVAFDVKCALEACLALMA